jgi:alpha-tubulin suppressor-like RCC1 family protein
MLAPTWRWILVVLGISGCLRAVRPADDPVDGFVESDAVEDAPETGAGTFGSSLAVGTDHTCAQRASGQVLCWGANHSGQLGDGSAENIRTMPVAVADLTDAVEVAAGNHHTCARRATGRVLCWGSNAVGQLGDGTTMDRARPVPVVGLTDAVEVSAGIRHACARRAGGQVLCWGENRHGVLGDGTMMNRATPVAVRGL